MILKSLWLAAALAASPAAAQSMLQGDIRYLSGGRTADGLALMRESADDYNLRLRFTVGYPGRYVEGTRVRLFDRRGKVVLALRDSGPLLYVDLPRGRYILKAARGGIERTRVVVVGKYSGVSTVIAWPLAPLVSRG